MNIFELKNALDKISAQAHEIFVTTGYEKLGELAYVDFDPKDPNQAFLYEEFYSIVRKLDHAAMQMDYINIPILQALHHRLTLYRKVHNDRSHLRKGILRI